MQDSDLTQLARRLVAGELAPGAFLDAVAAAQAAIAGEGTLDLDRLRRCGHPEVIYGEGKPNEALRAFAARLLEAKQPVLMTRINAAQAEYLAPLFPAGTYNPVARTFRVTNQPPPLLVGKVPVLTAGVTDRPVAEEARETLDWMGVEATIIADVGVAGPHRLVQRVPELRGADAIVVAAGMEGALPSVVGGYVPCPVIAVPTSVGYGAAFGGLASLLSMLNSCAANVTVVNIDAGFKAGFVAGLIARNRHAER